MIVIFTEKNVDDSKPFILSHSKELSKSIGRYRRSIRGRRMIQFPKHIVAVGGIVENDHGDILLVKHRDYKAWGFPGGQVENGENLIDAVIREIKEESGISIIVVRLIAISSNTAGYEGTNGYEDVPTKVMFDFACKFISGELSSSNETSESKWVKKEEVMDYMTAPAYCERFQAYLDFDGAVTYMEYVTRPEFILKMKRLI